MATGFTTRNCIALLAPLVPCAAAAADVALIGTFDTKAAILSIDAGAPKTVKVGQSFGGVTLISVEKDRATVEVEGKRRILQRGQTYSSARAGSGAQTVTLAVGAGGHFMAEGQVNGGAIRFVVDTGATSVAIPASDASRLRIDYQNGQRVTTQTASGPAPAWLVTLASVRVGDIELQNVQAIVIESGLPVALLGNSFLGRMDMRREGQTMTLTRRY
ncbi:MAG: TIGR02281 family clan AA aspartic protease [Burkholderiales bacterium]|nr:TIGR02281 family clan AA aspartic protease [Burkholderiales bacterium]